MHLQIPVEQGSNQIVVTVSGLGSGRMNVDFRYNVPASPEGTCSFDISIEEPSTPRPYDEVLAGGKGYMRCLGSLEIDEN